MLERMQSKKRQIIMRRHLTCKSTDILDQIRYQCVG